MTVHAETAKAIRAELKENFANVKFSVRARSGAVTTYWTDGPTTSEVETVISKYQIGHFDGMTDSYEYSNRDDSIPQIRFVFTNREMSPETEGKIRAKIEKYYGIDLKNDSETWEQFRAYPNEVIYREFNTEFYTKDVEEPQIVEEKPEAWMEKLIDCGCM